jgi:octaprenyl-diphosphate synthase
VEFIHTATLLHDDVVDESMLRRGRPTANAVFGNAASVLVGDFLYSRAFQMMVSVGDLRVLEVLAEATNVIAEGEVLQLMNMHQPDVALESYLQVIRYKTAKLFEASARLGAVLAGAPRGGGSLRQLWPRAGHGLPAGRRRARLPGRHHHPGQERGRRPARRQAHPAPAGGHAARHAEERQLIRHAIEHGEVERLREIVAIVHRTGALEVTRQAALQEAEAARQSIATLPLPMPKNLARISCSIS